MRQWFTIFTFHYGSILMENSMITDLLSTEFTFHYGSILIEYDLPKYEELFDLHSTMVLF